MRLSSRAKSGHIVLDAARLPRHPGAQRAHRSPRSTRPLYVGSARGHRDRRGARGYPAHLSGVASKITAQLLRIRRVCIYSRTHEQRKPTKPRGDAPPGAWCPDGAVLIAEAANAAAKITDDYAPKVAAFVAAAQIPGVESGWGDDGCWYLQGPLQGPVCAHDPWSEIARHLPENLARRVWPHPWDGKIRQPYAFVRASGHSKTVERALRRGNA